MLRKLAVRAKKSLALSLVMIAFITGCESSDQFETFKAEGNVTLNGKPLADAHVWLVPREKPHQDAIVVVRPQGRTGQDGKFVLTTYLQNDGAPEGQYDAIILHGANDPDAAPEESSMKPTRNSVPMKYKDAKTSGLLITIKNGTDNVIPLDLKTK